MFNAPTADYLLFLTAQKDFLYTILSDICIFNVSERNLYMCHCNP